MRSAVEFSLLFLPAHLAEFSKPQRSKTNVKHMLVPSSAVESMGMGRLLGAATLRQERLTSGAEDTKKEVIGWFRWAFR
ncbi:MAG: hypothetical protein ACRD1Q_12375 [Vicinamibacterales bacterium]